MDEKDWSRLVDQLKNGVCTPLLGPGTAPRSAADDAAAWLGHLDSPFPGDADPPWSAQFTASLLGGAAFIRQRVADEVRATGPPDFGNQVEPHALLSHLPLPVYLTTNYDGFLADALHREGKNPRSAICPWYVGADVDEPSGLAQPPPNSREPAVYHLYGSVDEPRSMVVTEEDHLEFLLSLARDRAAGRQIIPTHLRPALTTRPLLFLGYDVQDWTFRFLFHALLRTVAAIEPRRRAVLQLDPPGPTGDARRRLEIQRYLTNYFQRWNIAVFWGSVDEFCGTLADHLGWT
jgi:hypothetical protein